LPKADEIWAKQLIHDNQLVKDLASAFGMVKEIGTECNKFDSKQRERERENLPTQKRPIYYRKYC